ncbi:MAG: type II toxin-antitoxin system ParD family antitoxin [Aphanizomenon sp.]|jgi:metal-responsive CopG/Arc/MetJ family transcriptional regulator|uniref:CopG family transcriptional regulator n=2 Tax=Aphanizomenon flos-aquae TaxID=1176 RepID=A0A1B7X128_APHFL|nr:CopG family transcriptional regulator [Aphanizomenon flos-aquae UKL13-PB]MBO1062704.1 CopG family transcriptional regulator [Aphanizomenon flos-aquae CP01]NTW21072.1 CopG family transcriptional regulator [Nostocales cyanobacterium W4_Combined_metabat2_030]OBQ17382.1 MAG: CopG family transcriptional regulator [Anabaena sp. WA113]OBQ20239.1 MAG: CopG family transcriptional regulator [Aphanizomenon flos-aquae LD13]OBQ29405.1 MAG: CopG family transcriptional regulator [Aphanizomenon flos-aquae 
MQTEKISISLPTSLMQFVENYKISKRCKSRSQVIELALDLLRNQELEQAYREASAENDPNWEITIGDGLTDETW